MTLPTRRVEFEVKGLEHLDSDGPRRPMLIVSIQRDLPGPVTLNWLRKLIPNDSIESARVIMVTEPTANIGVILKCQSLPNEELAIQTIAIG